MKSVLLGPGSDPVSARWEPVAPQSWLRPVFESSEQTLSISGGQNRYEFGYWRAVVGVRPGGWYRLSMEFEVEGIEDVSLHVLNMVLWRQPGKQPRDCPHDYVGRLRRSSRGVHAMETLQAPMDATEAEVQLGMRFAPAGRVSWSRVELAPAEPVPQRPARLSGVRWCGTAGASLEANRGQLAGLVDQAAGQGSDLVLLPEYAVHNHTGVSPVAGSEAVPDGPTCRLLAAKAREHRMYVCAGMVERCGELAFNTTVLFGRDGSLVGAYRKVHLYWPEEMWEGLSPGDELPVFDLDFATVAVMTCYDSWFPETARVLALKGAEVILFPSAGYHPPLLPARAVDNRAFVVASSLDSPAMIVDTLGQVLAETTSGVITVPVDLSRRPTPHPNAGGSLNTSPGGRRGTRNSMSGLAQRELVSEISRWEDAEPEPLQLAGER